MHSLILLGAARTAALMTALLAAGALAASPIAAASTPAAAGGATAAAGTPVAAGDTPTPDAAAKAARSACERTIDAFIGKDDAALNRQDIQKLGAQMSDLVICGAVLRDSEAACNRFMPFGQGPGKACRHMRSVFNEMRAYPNGRSFLLDDLDYDEMCNGLPPVQPFCKPLREALRSGDPKECAKTGDLESMCRAYLTLDPKLCTVGSKLATAEIALPDRKEGEPATVKIKEGLEAHCREVIESRNFLAKGLKEVAQSGPPREREFAKAALRQPGACETFVAEAVARCVTGSQAASGTPVPPTPERPAPAEP